VVKPGQIARFIEPMECLPVEKIPEGDLICGAGRYVAPERWPIELQGYSMCRRHIIRSEVS
jgi:hypothetical protein